MRATLMKKLRSFRHNDEGVTLVEYGVALVLAVTVGVGALSGLGTTVEGQMDSACSAMTGGTVAVCP
ncbi:Flp family type IVb pilin [Defluviimonas sp. SAOS-178_SWC]|uniref:Flp family type IVb pilin n=1 Tax=Defluviimonas sp. SAOS-178_SWC TaxID=3121287 RepID=UPI0032214055